MGDLVIGSRSGAGEPEDPGGRGGAEPTGGTGTAGPGGARAGAGVPAKGLRGDTGAVGPLSRGGGSGEAAAPDERSGEHSAEPARKQPRKQRSFWQEVPILIGIALVLALVIKTFFVQAFSIPSESMQDTLQTGDRVLVDKFTPWFGAEPERGDVVVFHDPGGWLPEGPPRSSSAVVRGLQDVLSFIGLMPSADEKDLIKRVIAVGGDTVECAGSGPVTVDGKALDEPYVYPGATPCGDKPFGPVKVPQGHIWVMGDHRNDSLDSRYHMDQPGGGTVPVGNVVGRAFVIAWPVNRWTTLPVPATFGQPGLAAAVVGTAPAALGLAGAVPLTLVLRRRRTRRSGGGRSGEE